MTTPTAFDETRVRNALRCWNDNANRAINLDTRIQLVLEADDAFRREHPDVQPVSADEPVLPASVTVRRYSNGKIDYECQGELLLSWEWTAEELDQITAHMRWRERQAAKPAPVVVSNKMIEEFYRAYHQVDVRNTLDARESVKAGIAAALAAKGDA